jgi:hypothetical protein
MAVFKTVKTANILALGQFATDNSSPEEDNVI